MLLMFWSLSSPLVVQIDLSFLLACNNHRFHDNISMTSIPPRPWLCHPNSSSTSLSRLGFEKAIPQMQITTTPSPVSMYEDRELPPVPQRAEGRNYQRPLSDAFGKVSDPKLKNNVQNQRSNGVHEISRPPIGFKSHSLPDSVSREEHRPHRRRSAGASKKILPRRPPPPMTKSAQKILQLTGFDPSFDLEPKSHYSVSPESSQSSLSAYSQPEGEIPDCGAFPNNHWEATPVSPTGGDSITAYLQSSISCTYSESDRSSTVSQHSVAGTPVSVASLRYRDRSEKHVTKDVDLTKGNSTDRVTNEKSIVVETTCYKCAKRSRSDDRAELDMESPYGHEISDERRKDLFPEPLSIRSRTGMMDENNKLHRYYTIHYSPTRLPYDRVQARIQLPRMRRLPTIAQNPAAERYFGSGRHSLRRPFQFSSTPNDGEPEEPEEPEQRFRKKFSETLKRLSGGRRSLMKQRVITNAQRASDGPDTPMPDFGLKSLLPSPELLQKGNEHIQAAVDKAKKGLKLKSVAEKNRQNLKKQIVVVGIGDQSPGKILFPTDGRYETLIDCRWEGIGMALRESS